MEGIGTGLAVHKTVSYPRLASQGDARQVGKPKLGKVVLVTLASIFCPCWVLMERKEALVRIADPLVCP